MSCHFPNASCFSCSGIISGTPRTKRCGPRRRLPTSPRPSPPLVPSHPLHPTSPSWSHRFGARPDRWQTARTPPTSHIPAALPSPTPHPTSHPTPLHPSPLLLPPTLMVVLVCRGVSDGRRRLAGAGFLGPVVLEPLCAGRVRIFRPCSTSPVIVGISRTPGTGSSSRSPSFSPNILPCATHSFTC